jgi:TonB-dependent SusC/RagA subfamily outer membrane receptor
MDGRMHRLPALLAFSLALPHGALCAQGDTRLVAGRVIDAVTGLPLPAGVVTVAGSRAVDRLRPDGVFVLRVPAGAVRLVVRSPGYERGESVVPEGREAVIIELAPLVRELDAVVVTDELPGGSLGRVTAATVEEAFAGRVAGLESMRNSGAPGDVQVRLRGVSTILGNGRPLWMLDGVMIQDVGPASGAGAIVGGAHSIPSRIADLNPHDIASVELLRGAWATAMYGSRGANGVVIVRTKRR